MKARAYLAPAGRDDWRTPEEVVDLIRILWDGPPDLDPCAAATADGWFARENVTAEQDGLARPWRGSVFVNPPFGDLATWAEKCSVEAQSGAEIVLLLPARTDTRYWHAHIAKARAIAFLRGRLTFVGAPSVAPFPTALAYWGHRPWAFHACFRGRGMVVVP